MEQVIDYLRLHLAGDEHAAMMMVVEQLRAETARAEKAELDYRGVVENFDLDSLNKCIDDANAKVEQLKSVLEIIRDADEDCKRDGLPRMPDIVRKMVDEALR